MYPQVVQFETRRSEVARELQLIRQREAARARVPKSAEDSVAFKSSRLRRLLNGADWSPLRRKVAIPRPPWTGPSDVIAVQARRAARTDQT